MALRVMSRLLLVDDDRELAGMLGEYFAREGFEMTLVHDGRTGVELALSGNYALAILDVMMPGLSGVEVLARVRTQSQLPVIMLTAKGDDIDRIVGLEMGADDYVAKPCTPRELVARVRSVLRRVQSANQKDEEANLPLVVDRLKLVPERRTAEWNAAPLDLTSTEFSLLWLLARQAGRAVGKGELSQAALGRPLSRYDRSIDVHISSLRHKLGPGPDGLSWIQTVRGIGYQLIREQSTS